ncbi:CTP synthase [Candidatus Nanohalococcus occultus]|uniref:CTP synthase n=1 Tax=Candidatus Nanohalococcus occultus TaxID=2978047 RepID=UPI0039DF2F2D
MPKWIFVTGGVLSGLGKGLISASVSKLLQQRDLNIVPVKCDGYLNVDPGTMNPHEHGEVYVLEDGTEVDMDFGHYERFLDIEGRGDWNLTSGKIFQSVINKEREGEYLGETVQMIPHVTDEIKKRWKKVADEEEADTVIVEIGGTVGDMENQFYLEAARQICNEEKSFLIHTTLVPYLETTGEQKTKPTQHSVKKLQEAGLDPDMVVGRSKKPLDESAVEKISLFCDVPEKAVVSDPNLESVYQLPLEFDEQGVDEIVAEKLDLPERVGGIEDWENRVKTVLDDADGKVAICGKYTEMDDSYASVEEALKHAGAAHNVSLEIQNVNAADISEDELEEYDGIVIPGGFGERGVEAKMEVIKYCRENNVPILGLCYGMQLMVIEQARGLGIDASSEEWGQDGVNVIAELPGQKDIEELGGTMRLGEFEAEVTGEVKDIYGSEKVSERHRHRYEVDPEYIEKLEEGEIRFSGFHGDLPEFVEIKDHKFFVGTQAHPEFKSSLQNPNPLYKAFIEACL